MNKAEIYNEINKAVCDILDDGNIIISADTVAADIEGWDSLANINILVSVENSFGIKFNMEDIENFRCVGDMVENVERKLML